jgi:hypothetical protein
MAPRSPGWSRTPRRTGAQATTPPNAQAAMAVADHRGGEIDHAFGHAAMGQEVAGQDEERDRHDLELLDTGEQLQRHRLDRHAWSSVNRKVSTVRPSEIEIGMPVSISTSSMEKNDGGVHLRPPFACSASSSPPRPAESGFTSSMPSTWAWSWCGSSPVLDEAGHHLQEAEAHEARAQRNRHVDHPGRPLEVRRGRALVKADRPAPAC